MEREEFAKKIRWDRIIWIFGMVNIIGMLPQVIQVLASRKTDGLCVPMFATYLLIQVAFAIDGYFKRNKVFLISMGVSAVISAINIGLIEYFRHFGQG